MRRLSMILVLALAAVAWPAASAAAHADTAAPAAAGSLEADFNNDGFADLAVGAPFEDIGATAEAGAVNVLYGAAGGLTGAGSQLFWQGAGGVGGSAEGQDEFGRALSAGDFDNDGFADLAVGVPFEDIGAIPEAGAVNVLYGGAGGLSGTGSQAFWQAAGGVAGGLGDFDRFGWALSAGDFNNDDFADLAVGVPGDTGGAIEGAGAVNVLYGAAAGLTGSGSQLFGQDSGGVVGTAESGDDFGSALAAGDFNNDGFADLAVGVPFEAIGATQGAGAVNVLYGAAGGLTGAGSQLFWQGAGGIAGIAEDFDQFGFALAVGDFNNNGFADLAVSAPFEDVGSTQVAGAVNVLYGGAAGGLSAVGNQQFWQGAGGVAGVAENFDAFGWALVGSDQPTGPTAASSSSQAKTPEGTLLDR